MAASMGEKWKHIEGFENYMVSSLGRVKRIESLFVSSNGRIRRLKERFVKGTLNKGYRYVSLQKTGDNRKYPLQRINVLLGHNKQTMGLKFIYL